MAVGWEGEIGKEERGSGRGNWRGREGSGSGKGDWKMRRLKMTAGKEGGKKGRNGGDRDTRERVGNREGEWLRVI